MYNFKEFIPRDPTTKEAELTQRVGNLVIFKGTAHTFHLNDFKFCTLHWDDSQAVMGISFQRNPSDNSLPVIRDPRDRRKFLKSIQIPCKAFCQLHDIDLARMTPLKTKWSQSEKKLIISGFRIHAGLAHE